MALQLHLIGFNKPCVLQVQYRQGQAATKLKHRQLKSPYQPNIKEGEKRCGALSLSVSSLCHHCGNSAIKGQQLTVLQNRQQGLLMLLRGAVQLLKRLLHQ